MVGFLVVTMIIGYEWFVSGLVKFVRGDFPSGLSAELATKAVGTVEWYRDFLKSVAIPHGVPFGYFIEASELLGGVVLLGGPLIWLFAWDRVSDRIRSAVLLVTAAAAVGMTFLAINLHIANGGSHPWVLPASGFDEGIDLDSELPAIQVVVAVVCVVVFRRLRRTGARAMEPTSSPLKRGNP